ncbi:MAG: DMT family transporter [Alphaproteobacteria bacterium]
MAIPETPAAAMPNTDRPIAAAGWVFLGMLCFCLMAVAGREAGRVMETADLLVWRSLVGALIVVVCLFFSPSGFRQVRTNRFGMHLVRNIGHFAGQYCWYTAVMLIPLAQLFAFEFTTPIWVALLAPFLLGEKFTWARIGAIVLGFAGILVVVRPGAEPITEGTIWAFLCTFGFTAALISTKRLSRTETTLCILFYLTVMQAPMGMLVSGGLPEIPPDGWTLFWTLSLAFAGLGAHFCITQGYKLADATLVAPMDFFRLPLISLVGVLFYFEPFEIAVLFGGILIFSGNFINILAERRRRASR